MSRVLLVCGSLNQTTMMHRIGAELSRAHECVYSPFYADAPLQNGGRSATHIAAVSEELLQAGARRGGRAA